MEEPEPAEQPELLSLIISGEEEVEAAAPEESDTGEDEGLTNGHVVVDPGSSLDSPVTSPGTNYWSITEGPDHNPLFLSLIPGPSAPKFKTQRASRPGLSRIPGRDHRRYYHEYWRSEYLMDFDPQRHGMICMVCGSSLATLKLSTIKRHIRQKHPDSLLWSPADKEVIRSGWESHLKLSGAQSSDLGPPGQDQEEQQDSGLQGSESLDPMALGEHLPPVPSFSPRSEVAEVPQLQEQVEVPEEEEEEDEEEQDLPGPSPETLERYLNDSLHAWFRQEFLMEYESEASRILCMVCGGELPSLHLDHIKSHVLETHPNSLVFSAEEKHCVLQAWAQTREESENSIKSEPGTKEDPVDPFPQDPETVQTDLFPQSVGTLSQEDPCLIGEDGGITAPEPLHHPQRKAAHSSSSSSSSSSLWHLRLDYLVACGPQGQDTLCMVCSQVLPQTKVSGYRRHIQECHPETTALSHQEREAMAAAWTKNYYSQRSQVPDPEVHTRGASTGDSSDDTRPDVTKLPRTVKKDKAKGSGAVAPSRHSHYPGKDQKRNYQMRWRMDFLMDYDPRRHGLICMVCGATLATLKVSTIKRHIQHVHPHSLQYSLEEKQQALLTYDHSSTLSTSTQDHDPQEPTHSPTHTGN